MGTAGRSARSAGLATLPYGGMTRIRFEGYLSPAAGFRGEDETRYADGVPLSDPCSPDF